MTRLNETASRVVRWSCWRPWHYWVGLIVPASLLSVALDIDPTEAQVRYAALGLQIVGFGLLLIGINSTIAEFAGRGLLRILGAWTKAWWRDRPFLVRQRVVEGTGIAVAGNVTLTARGIGKPSASSTLEQRLAILEESHYGLHAEVGDVRQELAKRIATLEADFRGETDAVRKDAAKLADQLVAKFVDGIGLDLLGIWLFLLGTVLGGIPEEISSWLAMV